MPIILGSQFNRDVTSPDLMHPTKLGEAGDIERVANLIIGLWNNQFSPLTDKASKDLYTPQATITAKILKNRDGLAGIGGEFSFDNTGKFSDKPFISNTNQFDINHSKASSKEYAERSNGY